MQDLIRSSLRFAAPLFLALSLLPATAGAQTQTGEPSASTLRVSGEGSVMSRPDRVEVDLGVVTQAATAQQATADNARRLQSVLASLRASLGPRADIQTISFTLQPNYQFPPQGQPTITGYTATNLIRVTQDDVSNVGALIDAATRSGTNDIERIRFTLKDESAAKAASLRAATVDARAKANALASSLNLRIVRIRTVDEVSPPARPIFDLALARGAATTPILPGAIETTATVSITFDIASR